MTGPEQNRSEHTRFPDGFRIMQGKREYITYIDHSTVRIWPSDQPGHYDSHSHSAIEIIMPHRGQSVYTLSDQTVCVRPGEILFLPPGCVHALNEGKGTLRYLFLFEPECLKSMRDLSLIDEIMQKPVYLRNEPELQQQISEILMQAVYCYFEKDALWNTQCYSYFMQVYACLGRKYSGLEHRERNERRVDSEILNSTINYINEHYMENLSLEDAADFAGFSRYYFSRTFKQFAGLSFTELLTLRRVNAAADLLVSTAMPIREVAEASGFGSVATFNRVFREQKKCTPTQFRSIYGVIFTRESRAFPFTQEKRNEGK